MPAGIADIQSTWTY